MATIQHGGGTNGQISLLMVFPEMGFSAAILTNSNEGSKATSLFSRMVVEDLLGLNPEIIEPATNYLERRRRLPGSTKERCQIWRSSLSKGRASLRKSRE
ncbi:hypothetical protein [Mesotoga sp.]|uniref:hypothetical protein n=1 Tax=Mesotoga sp. TaxID=2053577 RepID=UPI001BD59494|nr:hypothetical protein [Mesotoga sp.]